MIDEEKAQEEAEKAAAEAEKPSPTKKGDDKENKPQVKGTMLFHKVDHNDTKGDGKIKIASVRKF